MASHSVLIAVMARGHYERSEIRDFVAGAYCLGHPLVGKIICATVDQSPTPCARNTVVAACRRHGFRPNDIIIMIDHDMVPSLTFFKHALETLHATPGPTVIASPYVGSQPACEVQVVDRDANGVVRRVSHEEAAVRTGTQPVMLMGTGLFAANLTAYDAVSPPCFDYHYDGPRQETATQTEDFYFCAKLLAETPNAKVLCAWDHWSGHDRGTPLGKPVLRAAEKAVPA